MYCPNEWLSQWVKGVRVIILSMSEKRSVNDILFVREKIWEWNIICQRRDLWINIVWTFSMRERESSDAGIVSHHEQAKIRDVGVAIFDAGCFVRHYY